MKLHPSAPDFVVRHYSAPLFIALLLLIGGIWGASAGLDATICVILGALALLVVAVAVIHTMLHERTTRLFLSEEEVVYEFGIVSRTVKRVPIHQITDTSTERDFTATLLGSCTLHVNTAGTMGYEIMAEGFKFSEITPFVDALYKLIHAMPNSLPDKKTQPKQK